MFKGWRSGKHSRGAAPENETVSRIEKAVSDSAAYAERTAADEEHRSEPNEAAPVTSGFRTNGAHWMDEVMQDQMKKGNLDRLPGEGKPLYLGDDHSMETLVNNVLKTANYLPRWVELRQEIKADIEAMMKRKHRGDSDPNEMNAAIDEVNRKIRKYNDSCPSASLQRSPITNDNVLLQFGKWK